VPDSLHGLLAARLDALDPTLRSLVADAAVLGSTFPAEALVAVSALPADSVETAMRELLRRGVFEISADPLSPQRGSYHFSQNLLRQVAYDTLSRRDRKARHLAVAAHLRTTFANDGDEVMDVVARHYLDALAAVADDTDIDELRTNAVAALVRAGERAERSGAPERAAEAFAKAAELGEQGGHLGDMAAAALWERAAAAAGLTGAHENTHRNAERARALYLEHGERRKAACAQRMSGRALQLLGRHAEAREELTAALDVLRPDPDHDTVIALRELAALEIFAGHQIGEDLSDEALTLGQALDIATAEIVALFIVRGIGYTFSNRSSQAIANFEHAARLAEQIGDNLARGRALLNLSSVLIGFDPPAGIAAARVACDLCRRTGARYYLSTAVLNFVAASLITGQWDEADAMVTEVMHADGLDNDQYVQSAAAQLAGLRGDLEAASANGALPALRESDDPQDVATAILSDALLDSAAGRHHAALEHARTVLGFAGALGMSHEKMLFGWPLAVRSAFLVGDVAGVEELIAMLDSHPVGHLSPLLRAERTLARANLSAARQHPDADGLLAEAISQLRALASPYYLAQALLDLAEHRIATGVADDVELLIDEARATAEKLRARPLLDRAVAVTASIQVPRESAVSGDR
jgi:tetratricopeptide (TPR) repeat protein